MEINNILKDSNIPSELFFLAEMINESPDTLEKRGINWELFLELAIHHRIFPLIPSKCRFKDELIPDKLMKQIKGLYQQNTFRMLSLTSELISIDSKLKERQITAIFLKGPVLAVELYGDISLRTSSDIDILVPLSLLEEVKCVLVKMGYEEVEDYEESVLGDWKWRHHHVTFIHPSELVKVEVHWRLNPGPGKEPSFSELWSRKKECIFAKTSLSILGEKDLFYFLSTHGARHGWSRLRWLVDIHHLILKKVNIEECLVHMRKFGVEHIGKQTLILVHLWFQSLNEETWNMVILNKKSVKLAKQTLYYFENMTNLHEDFLPEEAAQYHKRHILEQKTVKQLVLYLVSTLYPYPEDTKLLPLPKKFYLLYFPLKPFLWLWRKTKAQALT